MRNSHPEFFYRKNMPKLNSEQFKTVVTTPTANAPPQLLSECKTRKRVDPEHEGLRRNSLSIR